jgi:hypothetical protein
MSMISALSCPLRGDSRNQSKNDPRYGDRMWSVRVRLHQAHLSAEMVEMRSWLDRNQCEPTRFDCYQGDDDILLCVEFRREETAEAFAKRFDGEIRSSSAFISPQPTIAAETDRKRQRRRISRRYPHQERRSS